MLYKKLALILLLPFILTSCLTWSFFHAEIDCPWDKYIDTQFYGNFNKKNVDELLNKIEIGMSKDDVVYILGTPFKIRLSKEFDDIWDYSNDGAAPFDWDFSWYLIRIIFDDGKVVEKILERIQD